VDPSFPDALSAPRQSLTKASITLMTGGSMSNYRRCRGAAFPPRALAYSMAPRSPYVREPFHESTTAYAERDNAHTSGGSGLIEEAATTQTSRD
jgi:hypothetical protein